jgi:hypothetical protein
MLTPFSRVPAPPPLPELTLDQIADLAAELSALEARHATGRLSRQDLKRLHTIRRHLLHNLPTLLAALQDALARLAALTSATEPQ